MDNSKRNVIRIGIVAAGAALALPGCGGGGGSSTGAQVAPGVNAQKGEVSGNVLENRNSPVGSRAGIVVSVGDQSSSTDANGRFSVKDAPEGNQQVVFQSERSKALLQDGPVFNAEIVSGAIAVNIPANGSVEFVNVRIQDDIVVADQIITTTEDGTQSSISGGSLPPRQPVQEEEQETDTSTSSSTVLF